MNRTILIVICDFLLVSLLAFSTVDINKTTEDTGTVQVAANLPTNAPPDAGRDLAAVMKLALDDEQQRRELLLTELSRSREAISEREKQVQSYAEKVQSYEQRVESIEQQRAALQQQFSAAQTNLAQLSQQVRASSADALVSKEKLAAMEAELQKRAAEAAAMQRQMSELVQSNQLVLGEKQRLATQLQVAEVEKRHATEQVVAMQEQVKVERAEKARLVEGVKALATNSTQLAQEIREHRPLAPNTIFEEFLANRMRASFSAYRSGIFDTNKRKDAGSVLVTDGTNTFAVCHVEDTPFTFWIPGTQWEGLSGSLARETTGVTVRSLSFHLQDPRIVFMPVTAADVKKLGSTPYRISTAPFRFQEAVLVGATENYYGECRFEIDPSTSAYVKLDRSVLRGLFGRFNPSRGDLVFSRTGELLGIMANNTYCLRIQNFDATATFSFGPDVRAQNTGSTLAALYAVVQQLPLRLQ